MNDHVPEVIVPSWVIQELECAADPIGKSLEIAVRTVRALREICAGAHIMTVHWEDVVPGLLDAAGL